MDQLVCTECLPRLIAGYNGWLEVKALTVKDARDFCLCGRMAFFHLKAK